MNYFQVQVGMSKVFCIDRFYCYLNKNQHILIGVRSALKKIKIQLLLPSNRYLNQHREYANLLLCFIIFLECILQNIQSYLQHYTSTRQKKKKTNNILNTLAFTTRAHFTCSVNYIGFKPVIQLNSLTVIRVFMSLNYQPIVNQIFFLHKKSMTSKQGTTGTKGTQPMKVNVDEDKDKQKQKSMETHMPQTGMTGNMGTVGGMGSTGNKGNMGSNMPVGTSDPNKMGSMGSTDPKMGQMGSMDPKMGTMGSTDPKMGTMGSSDPKMGQMGQMSGQSKTSGMMAGSGQSKTGMMGNDPKMVGDPMKIGSGQSKTGTMGSMDPKTGMMDKEKDMPMKTEEMGGNKGKTEKH